MNARPFALLAIASAVMLHHAPAGAQLPVRKVVLYKHGVGYFERAGQLAAGESARLEFKAAEMNDVLKSLMVTERGGGAVRALRYDASDPVTQQLAEFPFRIVDQQSLPLLLDQMKGARLEITQGSESIAGTILGARQVAGSHGNPDREQVSLLTDGGELRTLDLAGAKRLRLTDPALQKQLSSYLQVLLQSRSTGKRSVTIDSTPGKARDLTVGYVIPAPAWKSAYRLLFQEQGQALLEGWAIVDNTTGEDWKDVSLAMVSGRPVSFISPLYEPRHMQRPIVQLPDTQVAAPRVFSGAIPPPPPPRPAPAPAAKPAARAFIAPPAGAAFAPAQVAPSSIQVVAETRDLGELFEYRIAGTVTVRRSESAMLPFVQQRIAARKLSVYADANAGHPLHAAELSNVTGKTLDGGPITIYEGGAYGGEALIDTLKSGDRRLIAYGVDLGTRISTHFASGSETVREVKLNRGVLTSSVAVQETRTYTIHNLDKSGKTLIIEQPARPEYTLVGRKAEETTANAYRFELKLAAGVTEKFAVVEERVMSRTTALANMSTGAIVALVDGRGPNEALRRQLEPVIKAKQGIAALEERLASTDREVASIGGDQERIRRNIASLNNIAGQQEAVQSYVRQLSAQETRLVSLRDDRAKTDKELAAARTQLDRLLSAE